MKRSNNASTRSGSVTADDVPLGVGCDIFALFKGVDVSFTIKKGNNTRFISIMILQVLSLLPDYNPKNKQNLIGKAAVFCVRGVLPVGHLYSIINPLSQSCQKLKQQIVDMALDRV